MNLTEINNVSSAGESLATATNKTMGKDDFLNLLVTQLKNQDPLDPMESAEFASQLAQFSSLEQLTNMNSGMDRLIEQQAATINTQAMNFIGQHVKAEGNSVAVEDGVVSPIPFELEVDAVEASVYIFDENDGLVKTLTLNNVDNGEHQLAWDGRDESGNGVEKGVYQFEVVAMGPTGDPIPVTTFTSARVERITMNDGETVLIAGDLEIPFDSVVQVGEPETDL